MATLEGLVPLWERATVRIGITRVPNGGSKGSVSPTQHSCWCHANNLANSACLPRPVASRQETLCICAYQIAPSYCMQTDQAYLTSTLALHTCSIGRKVLCGGKSSDIGFAGNFEQWHSDAEHWLWYGRTWKADF